MVEYSRSILKQIAQVIQCLSLQEYACFTEQQSSVGAHIRHILDHFSAVVDAVGSGVVDYSRRARVSSIEHKPAAAIQQIIDFDEILACKFSYALARKAVKLIPETTDLLAEQSYLTSNMQRELLFVASHAVHHLALIKMRFAAEHKMHQIEYLGYAPATIQALKSAPTHK